MIKYHLNNKYVPNGQHARLLHRPSEFEFRWNIIIYEKIFENNEINRKIGRQMSIS